MMIRKRVSNRSHLLAAAIGGLLLASPALADPVPIPLGPPINLTVTPYSGAGNQGDLFTENYQQPTGTGVIRPFLSIQRKGQEHGFNSDATIDALLLDDDRSHWVHSLKMDDIAAVTLAGHTGTYAQFLLDINETNNTSGRLLSMDKLELFSTSDPNLTGYSELSFDTGRASDGFGGNATMIYNMDATLDYTVELDYSLNHGSGSGDMYVFIPYSLIQAQQGLGKYLVLYSSFGNPNTSSAGFEEWSVLAKPSSPPVFEGGVTPLPSAALGGAGLMSLLALKRRRAR